MGLAQLALTRFGHPLGIRSHRCSSRFSLRPPSSRRSSGWPRRSSSASCLPGGQLPPERELARQLEISRTCLRQALTALTQSGLVTTSRGRRGGTFVADPLPLAPRPRRVFDEDELRAFLDHRLAIETGVAIRAAERAVPADLEALVELTDEMDESTHEFEGYRQADLRFHMGLAEAAHSPRLVEAMRRSRRARRGDRVGATPAGGARALQRPAPRPDRAASQERRGRSREADPRARRRHRVLPGRDASGAGAQEDPKASR